MCPEKGHPKESIVPFMGTKVPIWRNGGLAVLAYWVGFWVVAVAVA
jgi:hypothetical protein